MRLTLIAVLGFIVLLVLPHRLGAESSPWDVVQPTYSRTDYWKYLIKGGGTLPPEPGGLIGTFHIEGSESIDVDEVNTGSITLSEDLALNVVASYTPPGGTKPSTVQTLISSTTVRTLAGSEAGDTNHTTEFLIEAKPVAGGPSQARGWRGTVQATLLEDTWRFPLTVGARGRTVTRGPGHAEATVWPPPPPPMDITIVTTTEYQALSSMTISTIAGTFETLVVESWANATVQGTNDWFPYLPTIAARNHTRTYYSPVVGNAVRVETYDAQGQIIMKEELLEFRYAAPLQGAITADVRSGTAPLAVQFNATVSGGVPAYAFTWDFGDNDSSTLTNPVHTFRAPGIYKVNVVVTDGSFQRMERGLSISVTPPPRASFPPFSGPPLWLGIAGGVVAGAVGAAVALRLRRRRPGLPPR